ncbi:MULTISPECIES: leucyl aminopeptidase [unclassified Corynebacterium]|uniref:leucyl aminopeptidase n=1 Tax=unclassified Corynebacterium TaxID=2624378 RepID=UPI0021685173|nr:MULTISPECIES: leucyl aminopeptidase [unclassified Corynebacterium]MCS4488976.1 leucyl aminopeptidase [Corynebacterium sp. ES2775-CONJ]MCS4490789.1 leucyl aminopeptidase [Corynebacterium sp. ES2715-CONJ3]
MNELSSLITGARTRVHLEHSLPNNTEALIIPAFAGEDGLELAASGLFDDEIEADLLELLTALGATGKKMEITKIPAIEGIAADIVVAVGLGDNDAFDADILRQAAGVAARSVKGLEYVATTLGIFGIRETVEGIVLGAYHYDGLKTSSLTTPVENVTIISTREDARDDFDRGLIAAQAVTLARDLVNAPSSHLFPESYANIIDSLAQSYGLEVSIRDEHQLAAEGFGGILAVGQGSSRKPRLVQLKYRAPQGHEDTKHISFVGKGITFDTGGISIKPGANMDLMITDMGGSAAVIATTIAAARLGLNVNITTTVSLAENMPGGNAYRPGDVITHYGGKTTEVLNTDAEGRLVMADAIVLASEDNPDYLIDTATLTGAQIVALGDRTMGIMGDTELITTLAELGNVVGEGAWPMPLPEELAEAVKSEVADLRNVTNSRAGGMLSAGCFLREFVGDNIPWAHVDIAGPSFNSGSPYGFTAKRATGVPVRTFLAFLDSLS